MLYQEGLVFSVCSSCVLTEQHSEGESNVKMLYRYQQLELKMLQL